MSGNWIKLHRKFIDWEWYADLPTKCFFLHCLIRANHADKQWMGKTIKRGEFVSSLENLSKETNLSKQQIRTAIQKLQSTQNITHTSTNKYTIIKVDNYEIYQEKEEQEQHAEQQTGNKQSTNNQQTDNKQTTTNKNLKNEEEVKNVSKKEKINKKEKVDFRYEIVLPPPPSLVDKNLWDLFVEHRKSMKKPLSIHACELFYKDFRKWDREGIDVNECIKTSITNGWQGIFERNNQKNSQAPSQNPNWQVLKDWEKSRSEA